MLRPLPAALALGLVLVLAHAARAQITRPDPNQFPLGDLIEIVILEDEFLGVDAQSGGTASVRRRLREHVLWTGTRGLLGVIITNERILAIGTRSSGWQQVVYERGELPPPAAYLGDRVALLAMRKRVLGFLGNLSRFVEVRLGPHDDLRTVSIGANVGVALTDREALGLSPDAGGFFSIRLHLRENVESVVARSNLATVSTNERVLVFRGPTGTWAERRR